MYHHDRLRECFEEHLVETEGQIERHNECFSLLGETARAKPCKGMMGLVEEGQEVMAEGEEKEDALADLALMGAAQRVEHYEISGYTTAKNLAQQARCYHYRRYETRRVRRRSFALDPRPVSQLPLRTFTPAPAGLVVSSP
jgi:hypothetical protein